MKALRVAAAALSLSLAGCGGGEGGDAATAGGASVADAEVREASPAEAQASSKDATLPSEATVLGAAPTEDSSATPPIPDSAPASDDASDDASCAPDALNSQGGGCCVSQSQCPEMFCCALDHVCILCSGR
jgi:hypothetical protein